MRREMIAVALASLAWSALAQSGASGKGEFAPNTVWRGAEDGEEKPWVEAATPLPSALRTSGLIPIDVAGTTLRFGVDPQSVIVGDDGVIRYVVIASSHSGAVNAMQEGVRCVTREVKTYARHTGSGWVAASTSAWQKLTLNSSATRHSAALLRSGLCGTSDQPSDTAAHVVRNLRTPPAPL